MTELNQKEKVLLITPPCIELYEGIRGIMPRHNPLGLAYIAAFLEKNNIEVELYDSFAEDASMEDIRKRISESNADFIGITSVTSTIREAAEIAKIAKEDGKKTVIGGVHFTAQPKETLEKYSQFDYGIVGEGELTFSELVSGKTTDEIDGLVHRKENNVIVNKPRALIEDLSIVPRPARHLLKNELYGADDKFFLKQKKFFNIMTSRGCPYQCTFCASKIMWGTKARYRPVEDVIAELDELKRLGMEQLLVVDDTFTLDEDRVRRITEKIKTLGIKWGCNSRANTLTPEILRLLKDSNCLFIEFGIESGNQEILNKMKKGITLEQVRKALKLTKEQGFKTSCSFIIGNIGETDETVKDTINFAKELNPDYVFFNMLTPYPGTEVYNIAKKEGYLIKDFNEYTNPKYADPVIKLPTMDPEKLKGYCKEAYRKFYLSPRFILKTFYNSMTSFYEFRRNSRFVKSFVNLVK